MNVQNLITVYGSKSKAARAIGRAKQTINGWRDGIPYSVQCELWFEFDELKEFPPRREDDKQEDKRNAA